MTTVHIATQPEVTSSQGTLDLNAMSATDLPTQDQICTQPLSANEAEESNEEMEFSTAQKRGTYGNEERENRARIRVSKGRTNSIRSQKPSKEDTGCMREKKQT
ncbi:hypothetical protein R1sor_024783 [Riccia sorocarpa]|uniref:Uncharacterized protein n=1 Tax=Riccia sorocarpa TaxID=122646 RepID=A0ABD3GRF9_9MARC